MEALGAVRKTNALWCELLRNTRISAIFYVFSVFIPSSIDSTSRAVQIAALGQIALFVFEQNNFLL